MQSVFETREWQQSVAALVSANDGKASGQCLVQFIGATVQNSGTSLLAFHRDAPPKVIHHSLPPRRARHYLDRYLAGPYLLDPLYQMALRQSKPSMCRFREAQPDRFKSSEYYRQYVERTHLVDEMDFLHGVSKDSCLVVVCGRTDKRFTRQELNRLQRIEPIVNASLQRVWKGYDENKVADTELNMHQRLRSCFENFGEDELTTREREITQLLLRGHSSKSIARELGIAPGTVMVHKRNLFAKLGITSQFELFSRFIDSLTAT